MALGNKYGTHRVIDPVGALPQTANKVNNDMSVVWDNEILIDVIALNIDSASFTQIEEEAGGDVEKIKAKVLEIVGSRGKQQNPVTGSGGMLIGRVAKIGSALKDRDLKVGDKIASLVSLSLTPLKINKILKVHPDIDRLEVDAQAILFESGIYAKKGLLRHETEGNRHIYAPRVKKSEVLGSFLKGLVSNIFGGSAASAMQHLLQTSPVSEEEIREMRALLDAHTKKS